MTTTPKPTLAPPENAPGGTTSTGAPALPSEADVLRANRIIYNRKTVAEYDQNESIFTSDRQAEINAVLAQLAARAPGPRFVDVGCGTGNLLRLARAHFDEVIGVDQAECLLAEVKRKNPDWTVFSSQSHRLPFGDASVHAVGMYALLHHLKDPTPTLAEAARVLAPGGMLYTDHDPNRAFWRFHGALRRLTRVGRRQSLVLSRLQQRLQQQRQAHEGVSAVETTLRETNVATKATMDRLQSGVSTQRQVNSALVGEEADVTTELRRLQATLDRSRIGDVDVRKRVQSTIAALQD